jgi:hypothetical protein
MNGVMRNSTAMLGNLSIVSRVKRKRSSTSPSLTKFSHRCQHRDPFQNVSGIVNNNGANTFAAFSTSTVAICTFAFPPVWLMSQWRVECSRHSDQGLLKKTFKACVLEQWKCNQTYDVKSHHIGPPPAKS